MPADKLDQVLNKAKELLAQVNKSATEGQRQALTLPAPFAGLIASGQSSLVVSDTQKDIAGRGLLLADSEFIHGEVRLGKGKPISLAEFRRRQKEHRIPDVERKSAWPRARRLYAYSVETVNAYSKPLPRKPAEAVVCKRKTETELKTAILHKRQLTSRQVEKLQDEGIAVFSEIRGLCTTLKLTAPVVAEQTIGLMATSRVISDVLRGAGQVAEVLEPEFDKLSKALSLLPPEQTASINPFVLADDLRSALRLAADLLPPKSRPGVLATAAQKPLDAFLELEPDFQEASRYPELVEVEKEEATTPEVTTEVADDVFAPGTPEEQDQQRCVCLACSHVVTLEEGQSCDDLKCPVCDNQMALQDIADDAQAQGEANEAAIGIDRGPEAVEKAVWSTAYVNDLPDSAFLYIAPGGKKDEKGLTAPRSLRYLPIKDKDGELDLPHLRNAIARITQSKAPGLTPAKMKSLQGKARGMLKQVTEKSDHACADEDGAIIELGETGELLTTIEKAANAFTTFSGVERSGPAVFQLHFRGKAAHGDFRVQVGDELIGYTVALQAGGFAVEVASKADARKLASGFAVGGSDWSKPMTAPHGVFAALKGLQPVAWIKVDGAEFPPGAIGATADAAGYMVAVARPRVARGVATAAMHEYFLERDKRMQGRLVFRNIITKDEEGGNPALEAGRRPRNFWKGAFEEDLLPHVLTTKAVRKGVIPPKGWSWLPPQLKAVVPEQLSYWVPDVEAERKAVRKALIKEKFFTRDNLKLVDGEIRKVTARYYLYQPPQEVDVDKREIEVAAETAIAAPMPLPAPPAACQDTGETETSQDKNGRGSDSLTSLLKKAEVSVRKYIQQAKIRVLKYHTVDLTEGEEERYLMGEVLVPDDLDAQNDEYDEDDVRKAAHFFAEHGFFAVGLMHERTLARSKVRVLESYLAPIDMTIEDRDVKKGTWLLAARVLDDDLWQAVKSGSLTGWSIEGTAIAEEIS